MHIFLSELPGKSFQGGERKPYTQSLLDEFLQEIIQRKSEQIDDDGYKDDSDNNHGYPKSNTHIFALI